MESLGLRDYGLGLSRVLGATSPCGIGVMCLTASKNRQTVPPADCVGSRIPQVRTGSCGSCSLP